MSAEMPAWGFPTTPEHVTSAWLSEQLKEPVATFSIAKVGQGFTADAHKITFNDDKTVVLKLPSALGEAKQKAHAKDCTIEVLFYQQFAPQLAGLMKLPKVYSAFTDPAAPHHWCILMEDLGASGALEEFPSAFLFGKTHVPDVVERTNQLLSVLARVHGRFWQDDKTFEHPIFSVQEPLAPGSKVGNGFLSAAGHVWSPDFRGTGKTANQVVSELLEEHAGESTDVLKCKDVFSARGKFIELCRVMHTQPVQDAVAGIIAHFDSRPHTLLHGDAHLGNVFLDRANSELTWIDFQFTGRGPPGIELLQATTNLDKEDKLAAFKHYYDELIKAGPAGLDEQYSFDQLWTDWRYMLFVLSLCLTVAYFPDVVPYVAADAKANPDSGALKGWQLRCERWADSFELADIYSIPAEMAKFAAAKRA